MDTSLYKIIRDSFLYQNKCRWYIFNARTAIHISVWGKEYYKIYNIYGVQLSMTSSCIIAVVHRLISFQWQWLGMFFKNDNFAFLAIRFLNHEITYVQGCVFFPSVVLYI